MFTNNGSTSTSTSTSTSRVPHPIAAAIAVGALAAALLVGSASVAHADSAPADPANPATPATVSADALPTTQIDGVAWSQVVIGNTVYVAGKFTTARPAGSPAGVNTVTRNNLLAYNLTTGVLIPGFAPRLNAQALGLAASPDGTRLYVVGDFTSIDGAAYYRAAAFNTATNTIIPSFRPILESEGRAVTATNTSVYLGGTFSSVNGVARGYVAKLNASDGSVVAWNPNADSTVEALALTPDGSRLVMGGRFAHLGGGANYGLGAATTTTGAVVPWAANQKVRDGGTHASITSLSATNDRIYGAGYVYGSLSDGNLEGAFSADPNSGTIQWIEDCHGDTYSVFATGDAVYVAGHPHYCANIGGYPDTNPRTHHQTIAFSKAATGIITRDPGGYFNWAGNPRPSLLDWFPTWVTGTVTGQGQAAWSLAGNSQYLVVGGEFPFVNGVAQAGLTRFAVASIAPNRVGPNANTALTPTAASTTRGEVRVAWTATWDQDNKNLSYSVVRDENTASPVYTTTLDSTFWQRAQMGFVDRNLVPGSTHTYRVYARDAFGNSVSRLGSTVTVAGGNVSAPPPGTVLGRAQFGTATANSWGSADVGGAWTLAGAATAYSVAGGVGTQAAPAGSTKTSSLASVSSTATDLTVSVGLAQLPSAGGAFISAIGRDVGTTNYQARVLVQPTGAAQLQLLQGGTPLQIVALPDIFTTATMLNVRVQVFGTNPTTIRAKGWSVGTTEPTGWQASVTDTTAALQAPGSVGLRSYLSTAATGATVTTRFDNFAVLQL